VRTKKPGKLRRREKNKWNTLELRSQGKRVKRIEKGIKFLRFADGANPKKEIRRVFFIA
jgi:hypothetical protein